MRGIARNVLILVAAFAVTTFVLSSWGSGRPSRPESTIETFLRAAATGDGAKACAQLSPAAQREVVATGRCVDGILAGANTYGSIIAQMKITGLKVSGDTATAFSSLNGQPTATFTLHKSHGKWMIVQEQQVKSAIGAGHGSAGPPESRVEEVAACLDKSFGIVDNGGLDGTGGVSHVALSVDSGGSSAAEIDVFESALVALSGYQGIKTYVHPLQTRLAGGSVIVYLKALPTAKQRQIEACG
jgi:hypothetical protein